MAVYSTKKMMVLQYGNSPMTPAWQQVKDKRWTNFINEVGTHSGEKKILSRAQIGQTELRNSLNTCNRTALNEGT